jgi:electron transport complex protein RnfB
MNVILIAVIVLGGTGIILASVIFLTAKKFWVFEDPRIDEVQNVLTLSPL